ncbi:MAG: Co2+/Mg2+ efflux protein ApaG [Nitratireductor sp.]|nr:Co2+/Mg2+ efflux protein ApaG [Nitratireductor sp.]
MYRETTRKISVSVLPVYIDERSDPERNLYFWAYRVLIENGGEEPVQLVNRYWHITDETGSIEEVSGDGVVGEQPVIKPGEAYEYTSGCPLSTPSGIMVGHYGMRSASGADFTIAIPAFSLDLPDAKHVFN